MEVTFKVNVTEKEKDKGVEDVWKGMINFRSFGILAGKEGMWEDGRKEMGSE